MQVITKYYLKSHFHIKRIECMWSQWFPGPHPHPSDWCTCSRHRALSERSDLKYSPRSSHRNMVEAEWELKGVLQGTTQCWHPHLSPTRSMATYAIKWLAPLLSWGLQKTKIHVFPTLLLSFQHPVCSWVLHRCFRTQLNDHLLWEAVSPAPVYLRHFSISWYPHLVAHRWCGIPSVCMNMFYSIG